MKAQNPSTSLGEGRDVAPSLAHPSQKQNPVVYTEELTHLPALKRWAKLFRRFRGISISTLTHPNHPATSTLPTIPH
jgi:hypothetical protein